MPSDSVVRVRLSVIWLAGVFESTAGLCPTNGSNSPSRSISGASSLSTCSRTAGSSISSMRSSVVAASRTCSPSSSGKGSFPMISNGDSPALSTTSSAASMSERTPSTISSAVCRSVGASACGAVAASVPGGVSGAAPGPRAPPGASAGSSFASGDVPERAITPSSVASGNGDADVPGATMGIGRARGRAISAASATSWLSGVGVWRRRSERVRERASERLPDAPSRPAAEVPPPFGSEVPEDDPDVDEVADLRAADAELVVRGCVIAWRAIRTEILPSTMSHSLAFRAIATSHHSGTEAPWKSGQTLEFGDVGRARGVGAGAEPGLQTL